MDCSYVTLPVAIAADALPILVAISADETAYLFDFYVIYSMRSMPFWDSNPFLSHLHMTAALTPKYLANSR